VFAFLFVLFVAIYNDESEAYNKKKGKNQLTGAEHNVIFSETIKKCKTNLMQ
jgi:hypothetical protein